MSDNFKMLVPIYMDFGKGLARIGSARLIGNTSVEINDLKLGQPIKPSGYLCLDDVLALSIQNK